MNATSALVIAAAGLAIGPLPGGDFAHAAGQDLTVRRDTASTATLAFADRGMRTVDLRTINGTIKVTTDGGGDVRLTVSRHTAAERESDLPDADRDVRLDTSSGGGVVSAIVRDRDDVCGESNTNSRHDSWWDRRRYQVRVDLVAVIPQGARIRLCTINGESVVATGSFGEFDISNVNGRVEVTGVRGAGRAVTVNGPVDVTFAESPRDSSEFRSVNGNVIVRFPSDLSADLKLKTFHGELLTDFDVQPLPTPATPQERNGHVIYRSGTTTVRVGRGGPTLSFDTLNGDVRILRASR